jgi:hypothetical protein
MSLEPIDPDRRADDRVGCVVLATVLLVSLTLVVTGWMLWGLLDGPPLVRVLEDPLETPRLTVSRLCADLFVTSLFVAPLGCCMLYAVRSPSVGAIRGLRWLAVLGLAACLAVPVAIVTAHWLTR